MNAEVIRCFRFMRLFEITTFLICQINPTEVRAVVGWSEEFPQIIPSEETQEIAWCCVCPENIDDALDVGECAYAAGRISGDILEIQREELHARLEWDPMRIDEALRTLLRIRVRMIDDGAEGDAFFLHT